MTPHERYLYLHSQEWERSFIFVASCLGLDFEGLMEYRQAGGVGAG